ncbi:hypothetical protein EV715DRAFT_292878 [Schizophyllum commune]
MPAPAPSTAVAAGNSVAKALVHHNLPGTNVDRHTWTAFPGTVRYTPADPPRNVVRLRERAAAAGGRPHDADAPPPRDSSDEEEEGDPSAAVSAAPPEAKAKRNQHKDWSQAVVVTYGTRENMAAFLAANACFTLPTLAPSTLRKHHSLTDAFRTVLAQLIYQSDPESTQARAAKYAARAFDEGQALPTVATMKAIFRALVVFGDWTMQTSAKNLTAIWTAFFMARVETPDGSYKEDVRNALLYWGKQEGIVRDVIKSRCIVRRSDQVHILGRIIDPEANISTHAARVNLYALACSLYEFGSRPGAFVEDSTALGLAHVCRWSDLEILVMGQSKYGIELRGFLTFRYGKGAKDNEAGNTRAAFRSLIGNEAHMDPLLLYVVLGCKHGVWTQSDEIRGWMTGDLAPPPNGTSFIVKPEFANTGIIAAPRPSGRSYDHPYQPAKNQQADKQVYQTMSMSSAHYSMGTVAKALGYPKFTMRAYRITFSEMGKERLDPDLVPVALGHLCTSNLYQTVYKPDFVSRDITAAMHGNMNADTSAIAWRNSVAYNPQMPPDSIEEQRAGVRRAIAADEELAALIERLTVADHALHDAHGKHVNDIKDLEVAEDDTTVSDALDAYNAVILRYSVLTIDLPRVQRRATVDASVAEEDSGQTVCDPDLEALLAAQCGDHPLAPFVALDGGKTARARVFKFFTELLSVDDLHMNRRCAICVRNGAADKDHGDGLSAHVWACTEHEYRETHTRCYFCAQFVERDNDHASLNEHADECYVELAARLNVQLQMDTEAGKKEGHRILGNTITSADAHRTVYYCPVCFNSDNEDWTVVWTHFRGRDDLLKHMMTHLRARDCWDFASEYECRLHTCVIDGVPPRFTVVRMLEHWHNVHGYPLLTLIDGPPHPPGTALLLNESLARAERLPWAKDIKLITEGDLPMLKACMARSSKFAGMPLPYVVLTKETCRPRDSKRFRQLIEVAFCDSA